MGYSVLIKYKVKDRMRNVLLLLFGLTVVAIAEARVWNAGSCCLAAKEEKVDDVGFITAILDYAEERGCVDTSRVGAVGFSNGGFFAYRLGAEIPGRLAAVGIGSGGLENFDYKPCARKCHKPIKDSPWFLEQCLPHGAPESCRDSLEGAIYQTVGSEPVAHLHMHGVSDPRVPYDGGSSNHGFGLNEPGLAAVFLGARDSVCTRRSSLHLILLLTSLSLSLPLSLSLSPIAMTSFLGARDFGAVRCGPRGGAGGCAHGLEGGGGAELLGGV